MVQEPSVKKDHFNKVTIDETLSDEDLVFYIREKDKEAYSYIIDRYKKRIWRYINRLINNPNETDDLTQQTLVNVYVNLNSFDGDKKFSSWIYRIAHNLAVNWIKRKKASISLDHNEVVASRLSSEIDVFKKVSENEFYEKVTMLINKLPEKFKEPFILRYMEDKTYNEISDILRMHKSTVGTMINRAKKILKKELKKIYD